ncbi:MAG TPA: DJ-1/PfpI family protein [Acetobacteraceae bacterium]|jgi:cyclohexyl-isocyanide hydratase|nr:DJ-1/PfpI family protein [Acetobacteraceae bacterium]
MSAPLAIVIPIYPHVTELDFTGPYQFLVRLPDATVTVASLGGRPVSTEGLTFSDLASLEKIARCDVLCVPGSARCAEMMEDTAYLAAIRRLALGAGTIASVCNGSLLLGAVGLLRGKRVACHWAWRELLPLFGAIPDSARVVRDGNILSGGGVTAGIDLALALIAHLRGAEAAQLIQLNLEYAPDPPFHAGRPESAPAEILATARARLNPPMAARRAAAERAAARMPDVLVAD